MSRELPPITPPAHDSLVMKKLKIPPRQGGVPMYRHKGDGAYCYAVVTLNGRDHYLGKYGTPESIVAYNELVARWLAAGRTLPDEQPGAALSVNEVLLQYVEHCTKHYAARRNAGAILDSIKLAIKPVRQLYGTTGAASFGPKALQLVRATWVQSKLARKTINERVGSVKCPTTWPSCRTTRGPAQSRTAAGSCGTRRSTKSLC
jgi:hypothetical protein